MRGRSTTLGDHQTKLAEQPANLIDQRRTRPDHPASNSVQRLSGLLLSRFNRHETHGWPAGRLTNRLGIVGVVFTALDVRLDELRCNFA